MVSLESASALGHTSRDHEHASWRNHKAIAMNGDLNGSGQDEEDLQAQTHQIRPCCVVGSLTYALSLECLLGF